MMAIADERAIFENEDWLVVEDGLEHKRTGYFIERESLTDRCRDGLWAWPLHMAEKSWCTMAPFAEAFTCATAAYRIETDVDLARTFKIARCEIAAWPQAEKVASNHVPILLRTLQISDTNPIFLEQEISEKSAWHKASQASDQTWRRGQSGGTRLFSAHARLRPSRFDLMRATSFRWKAPRQIRRTGTKLVRLIQAAWNIR